MIQLKKEHFFFAVWTLQRGITYGEQKTIAPGIKIKDYPVFRSMDSLVKLLINLPVSGIKPIVPGHLEILFRDMLNEHFNEINGRKGPLNERVVFMLIVMESYLLPIVGIDLGKCNDRASKIAADIFNNGFRVAETGFYINIKSIFALMVNVCFCLSRRCQCVFSVYLIKRSEKIYGGRNN